MINKYRKQINIVLIVILFLVVVSSCVSMLLLKKQSILNPRVLNEDLNVQFLTESNAVIENILPLSDEIGRDLSGSGTESGIQGFIEFSVHNTSDYTANYEVYLTQQVLDENTIRSDYIKVYLTDFDNNPFEDYVLSVPTYSDLLALSDHLESRLLYSGKLSGGEEQSFRLRSWLSDNYALEDETLNFQYDVHVRIK